MVNNGSECHHMFILVCKYSHPYKAMRTVKVYKCAKCGYEIVKHQLSPRFILNITNDLIGAKVVKEKRLVKTK